MTTNEQINITDNTRMDVNEQNETVINTVLENESAKTTGVKSGMKNVIAGIAGVVAGIGGAILITSSKRPDSTLNAEPGFQTVPETEPEPEHFNGAEIPIASSVNGNMSFDEAFATARKELGPGGLFSWHGNTYGTYYADEWDGFSDEYKYAFGNYPYNIEHEPYLADEPQIVDTELADNELAFEPTIDTDLTDSAISDMDEPVLTEMASANDFSTNEPYLTEAELVDMYDMEDIPVIPEDDANVSILNVYPLDIEGQDVTLVSAGVDGQDVVLVDSNLDGAYDITVVGNNDEADTISVYDIDSEDFPIEPVQELNETSIAGDSPYNIQDESNALSYFDNNADISNF